jgi:hypothetical protein
MIIKKTKNKNITTYIVKKDIEDSKMHEHYNKNIKPKYIKDIIRDDSDVYTEDGQLLLKFRKNKLNKQHIDDFYDNVIEFAKNVSTNRGSASGSSIKDNRHNPHIMTNILGYFDRLSPSQKVLHKKRGKTLKTNVRETRFNSEHPDKFKKLLPLIKEIDEYYKTYIPEKYKEQKKKANQTFFKIPNTSFTTITTNINFNTTLHTDKGDCPEGFGNLAVIEKGRYTGGETCFLQYGIGVDVRTGDVLFMDVHHPHGNLPIHLIDKDAIRLSIVCYLRDNIWKNTKGKSKSFFTNHIKTMKIKK